MQSIARNGLLAIVLITFLTALIIPSTSDARCRRWQKVNRSKPTTLYRGVTYRIRSSRRYIVVYDNNGYRIRGGRNVYVRPRWTGTFWIYGRNTSIRTCW